MYASETNLNDLKLGTSRVVAATARRPAARNMARSVNGARPTVRRRSWMATASCGSPMQPLN